MFQSSPVIADGRDAKLRKMVTPKELFQSSPVIADGRDASQVHIGFINTVSILARHC